MSSPAARGFHAQRSLSPDFRIAAGDLDLIPSSEELSRVEWSDHLNLARLLKAEVPKEWPPEVVTGSSASAGKGWWNWYVVKRDQKLLIGMIGLAGWPDANESIQVGCAFLRAFQRKDHGYAAGVAITGWVLKQEGVRRIISETPVDNAGCIRLLEKAGYRRIEPLDPGFLRFAKQREE